MNSNLNCDRGGSSLLLDGVPEAPGTALDGSAGRGCIVGAVVPEAAMGADLVLVGIEGREDEDLVDLEATGIAVLVGGVVDENDIVGLDAALVHARVVGRVDLGQVLLVLEATRDVARVDEHERPPVDRLADPAPHVDLRVPLVLLHQPVPFLLAEYIPHPVGAGRQVAVGVGEGQRARVGLARLNEVGRLLELVPRPEDVRLHDLGPRDLLHQLLHLGEVSVMDELLALGRPAVRELLRVHQGLVWDQLVPVDVEAGLDFVVPDVLHRDGHLQGRIAVGGTAGVVDVGILAVLGAVEHSSDTSRRANLLGGLLNGLRHSRSCTHNLLNVDIGNNYLVGNGRDSGGDRNFGDRHFVWGVLW